MPADNRGDYSYAANANLVIHSERRRGPVEPTGEAESLVGRIQPKQMGDRAAYESAKDQKKKKEKQSVLSIYYILLIK